MHWTSQATRQKEYAKIDKSNKGLRGLWRKLAPKWYIKKKCQQFYEEEDGSDAGSVRRYRLEPSEEWDEKCPFVDEELSVQLERARKCLDGGNGRREW